MADSDDEIQEKAKKYGWSPTEVAYYKSLRGDIPQAMPSPGASGSDPSTSGLSPSAGAVNPQNIDPNAAAQVSAGFQGATGMWAGGTAGGPTSMSKGGAIKGVTGGGSVMFGDTVIADHQRPALGYKNAPKYAEGGKVEHTPAQVPGIEPAQQQIKVRQDALHKLKEHDRHRVRKPEPKKPK